MKDLHEYLMFSTIIIAAILVVFIIARYLYLTKKLMIEKGIYLKQNNPKFKYIEIGCIVFGLGIGLLISSFFTTMDLLEDTMDLLVWGTILLFGATGLVMAHFIRKRLER